MIDHILYWIICQDITSGHWLESGQQPWGWGGAVWPSEQRTSGQTMFWQNSDSDLATAPKFIVFRHFTSVKQIRTFNKCHFTEEEWQHESLHVFTPMWLGNNWGCKGLDNLWLAPMSIAASICTGFPLEIFSDGWWLLEITRPCSQAQAASTGHPAGITDLL